MHATSPVTSTATLTWLSLVPVVGAARATFASSSFLHHLVPWPLLGMLGLCFALVPRWSSQVGHPASSTAGGRLVPAAGHVEVVGHVQVFMESPTPRN